MGGFEGDGEGGGHGAPGERDLLLADPEVAIESKVGALPWGDPDEVATFHENKDVGLAGVRRGVNGMVDGALEMSHGLLVVGVDKESSEAEIGGGLPGGCAPGVVLLWTVFTGPVVKSAESERALSTSNGDLIPLGVTVARLCDTWDVGAFDGEHLVEVGVSTSGALLLEEGEGADPVGVAGGADVPVDEIAKAAEVGILDGVGWMQVGTRQRRRLRVFRWDVRMGLSTLWTPKGGVLGSVQIQHSVRI